MEDLVSHDLSAAYALDALDDFEARAFEDHLGSCSECRRDADAFAEIAASLAYAVPPAARPDDLRDRIVAAATARAEVRTLRPARRRLPTLAAVAAAACLAVGIGAWQLSRGSSDEPRLRALALRGATGALVVGRNGGATLVVDGLPRAPAGKSYEVWVMRGRVSLPAGTFVAAQHARGFHLPRRVPRSWHVGVTLEPAAGSPRPTARVLFTSASVS
jgi:anti-sigma-K factor RskA